MTEFLLIIALMAMGLGATMTFVGSTFAVVYTITENKALGLVSILIPIVAIGFCLVHQQHTKYPLRLFFAGLFLVIISAPASYFLSMAYQKSIVQ
jgi:hypothetical protein